MGMYRWAVYFLREWNVSCKHVYGFNLDEWSDREGNTLEQTVQAIEDGCIEHPPATFDRVAPGPFHDRDHAASESKSGDAAGHEVA